MKKLEKKLGDLKSLISIAKKAGYVIVGQENLIGYSKKLYLILMDETAGKSLSREMNFLAKSKNIPILIFKDLALIVGIENCKAVGIKNKNFSDEIQKRQSET